MKFKKWYQDNKVVIWMSILVAIIMILIGIYVGLELWYCVEHPDCDMCQAHNMTTSFKHNMTTSFNIH